MSTKSLTSKMTRDIDPKTVEMKDLLAWYNENSGSTKPLKKFADRAAAEKRVTELKEAIISLSGNTGSKGKAAKEAAKGSAKKDEAKSAGRASTYAGKHIYRNHKGEDGKPCNPRREGSHGFNSYEKIKDGMTYDDYVKAGGRPVDLRYDVDHGFVVLKDK